MKSLLQSLALLLAVLMVPEVSQAAYVQIADSVYQDGTALYIGSGVTSLGSLQSTPAKIYCYATIPPACISSTFMSYGATLHVPTQGMTSYFTAQYWYNFTNVLADAVEPQSVTMSETQAQVEIGKQFSLQADVIPIGATPSTVYWSSTNTAVATVSGGTVSAKGVGECYIRAICVDKQALCHVTVTPQRVTITLDKQEARLLPNHLLTLTATCSPAASDLVVSSSNTAVALPRIVNGTIQVVGVSEGTAAITVSTADGWCYPAECQVTVYTEVGDVNCDGYVTISDVTTLIDHLLGSTDAGFNVNNADTNRDGNVTISDVTALIDYLLVGTWPWDEPQTETFTVNGVSFKMVTVEGGTFMMGASDDDLEAEDRENPAHQVTLSSYRIGETEVTQALWQSVMGSNPSYLTSANGFTTNLQRPVECVSWNDCQTFISKLNQLTGKNFRLPTEAEWEYAARGGKLSQGYKYAGSNIIDDVAWYYYNSHAVGSSSPDFGTHAVATKSPNELGLYDMSGNVWEWCQDWYDSYMSDTQTNPIGPASGSDRVFRGGGWGEYARNCRVSCRSNIFPSYPGDDLGLRLALDEENSLKFRLSKTVVEIVKGSIATVDILNGNGSYSVTGSANFITTAIDGETLTFRGTALGTATVQVTDNATGATAVLTVIVKESNGETFTVNGVSFTMVTVEGGTFTMGASDDDTDAYDRGKSTHQVKLSSYSIGKTEVTQELWQAVMGSNPSKSVRRMAIPRTCSVLWNRFPGTIARRSLPS